MAYDHNTSPASWWAMFGSDTPTLQKLALRLVSQCCSSSGCHSNAVLDEEDTESDTPLPSSIMAGGTREKLVEWTKNNGSPSTNTLHKAKIKAHMRSVGPLAQGSDTKAYNKHIGPRF
ncbi:hypothetical protein Zm00014a_029457 [Zea mays]|uniref:HAT C-terminal dimerisation domain-containing protein n=1 Tax=Zea mays TaxID=4577 RepID=A0A3L6FVN7_MAIZE|nr:hypothetical protein Zm00014a_029457 [Zea mays]